MKDTPAKPHFLLAGPVLAAMAYGLMMAGGHPHAMAATAAIASLTAFWWMTEAMPIPATSLIPFVALPLFGVMPHTQAAAGLGNHTILLLMGGFMMAKGLEKSGVHRRIALYLLHLIGSRGGKRVVYAFMAAGALLSMWISNTATCLILMPIALAAVGQLQEEDLRIPVVLGIAYACSIGGIATLIGTPPNIIFAGIYQQVSGNEYAFLQWMRTGLPVVLVGLPLAAVWLARDVQPTCAMELHQAEPWRREESRVLTIFGAIVALWIFRTEPLGGWSGLLGVSTVGDSTVALLGVAAMFLVPSGKGGQLLDWKWASDIPWGMLLMFAGGITLATGFQTSGLAELIGSSLSAALAMPLWLLLLLVCLTVTMLTEVTSNTATTTLLMPILGATAIAGDMRPELLMIPAAISASCAFMLPVATAPNAIAYGTGAVSTAHMAREGFVLNLLLAPVIATVCLLTI